MIFLFTNPIAGRGRAAGILSRLSRAFEVRGFPIRIFQVRADTVLDTDLVCDEPPTAVIVIGGDGTIRAVVERLLQFACGDASGMSPVLVVPLGTANLLAQHLRIRWNERELENQVVEAVTKMRVKRIDAAPADN